MIVSPRFGTIEPGRPPPSIRDLVRINGYLSSAHNTTLTQGFTLYKRHLDLVGLLDELYDPAHDHALAHGSRLAPLFASGSRHMARVRSGMVPSVLT